MSLPLKTKERRLMISFVTKALLGSPAPTEKDDFTVKKGFWQLENFDSKCGYQLPFPYTKIYGLTGFLSSSAGCAAPFWNFFRSFSLMVLKFQSSLTASSPPDAGPSGSLKQNTSLGKSLTSGCRILLKMWCRQLTRQSWIHPETALISTSCTCRSALSDRMSFWNA